MKAWEADKGFGVPSRVFNAVSLEDEGEVLTIGFVDIEPSELTGLVTGVTQEEAVRHSRIADVIESTKLHAYYNLRTEHDFTTDPREVSIGGADSLLAALKSQQKD
ncbi:MAG: hypothetical protein ACK4P3_04055 [Fimbriimonadaceae bacterium]